MLRFGYIIAFDVLLSETLDGLMLFTDNHFCGTIHRDKRPLLMKKSTKPISKVEQLFRSIFVVEG